MIVSEARLTANRQNGLKGRGPLSQETRAIAARNSLKHGLTGAGSVVPEGDAEKITRREEALTADMKPKTTAGAILIGVLATLSVRAERAAEQEIAATALRVRNAADAFDEERIEKANELFAGLANDPRTNIRKLKKMPEGVDRLIDEWNDLRNDLIIQPKAEWTTEHLERAGNLIGLKARHAPASRLGQLSRGVWGDFAALGDDEGAGLDEEFRREWARAELIGAIDAEIVALEALYETLDFETPAIDRAEAGRRALFDASKPACLARRYEAEARRGFSKALKEFRQVEAETAAQAEAAPSRSAPARPEEKVGSFRETAPPSSAVPPRMSPETTFADCPPVLDSEGRPLVLVRRPKTPG